MDFKLETWFIEHNVTEFTVHTHTAVYTVDEAKFFYDNIPGLHCKNLFLKDSKKGIFYLVSLPWDLNIPIKNLRKIIGAKKLSFAKSLELKETLGLEPGSVTPFGLINVPKDKKVKYFISEEILNSQKVCFHPNVNTETISITKNSFKKFLDSLSLIESKKITKSEIIRWDTNTEEV